MSDISTEELIRACEAYCQVNANTFVQDILTELQAGNRVTRRAKDLVCQIIGLGRTGKDVKLDGEYLQRLKQFVEANPRNAFMASIFEQAITLGTLTEKQLAAADRNLGYQVLGASADKMVAVQDVAAGAHWALQAIAQFKALLLKGPVSMKQADLAVALNITVAQLSAVRRYMRETGVIEEGKKPNQLRITTTLVTEKPRPTETQQEMPGQWVELVGNQAMIEPN